MDSFSDYLILFVGAYFICWMWGWIMGLDKDIMIIGGLIAFLVLIGFPSIIWLVRYVAGG